MKKKPKFYYVYIITNLIDNRQYVGSKICYVDDPENDGYFGSSEYLWGDIKKLGKENFKKEIIRDDYKNYKELLKAETFYILEYKTLEPNGYNRFLPSERESFNTTGMSLYNIWKLKYGIKEADKRYKEWKEHESKSQSGENNPFYGRTHTKETKDRIRKKQIERLKNRDYSESYKRTGQTIREKGLTKGERNGMFGKIWITNEKLHQNKIIKKIELKNYLDNGWTKGRKMYKLQRS
jgi:hypothetical protein